MALESELELKSVAMSARKTQNQTKTHKTECLLIIFFLVFRENKEDAKIVILIFFNPCHAE